MRSHLGMLAGILLFCATPAMADSPAPYSFSLPGIDYVFPFPDGYCLATGQYESQAKLGAAADRVNLTEVTYFPCADMAANSAGSSWGMVKTPIKMLNTGGTTRQQIIDYFKQQLDPATLQKLIAEGQDVANQGVHDTLGPGLTLKLQIKPLDTDANAAYMGGTVGSADGAGALIACVYATTVVKDRVFLLYLFEPYTGPRDITDLLAKVKAETANFIAANGG